MERRMTLLEATQQHHAEEIGWLKNESRQLTAAVLKLQKTMEKILWVVSGAAGMYLVNAVGLTEVIKRLLLRAVRLVTRKKSPM